MIYNANDMKKMYLLSTLFVFICSIQSQSVQEDWRDVEQGDLIYKNTYIDQPYVLKLNDNNWLCVFTTGAESESRPGQHIVAMKSTDMGKSWTSPVKIEPNTGPMSSWAIPYQTSYGRVYVFYNYNGDNVSEVRGKPIRQAGLLGWYCYKYSDDNGVTWSDERFRIPIRITAADIFNEFDGFVQMFWGIDKPRLSEGKVYFAFSKIGKFVQDQSEGWLLCSDNLDTQKDASKVNWKMLPDGEYGIRNPYFQSVQEEHNTAILNDGSVYCVFRTALGFMGYSISRDKGSTWSKPDTLRYASDAPNVMKNPRACPRLFKCMNGKYLLWYHNHGGRDFKNRTPVWVAGGIEKNGTIDWSQPEILLYTHNTKVNGMSYPDLVEDNGVYRVTETQKHIGRTHTIDSNLLEGLWRQQTANSLTKTGLVFSRAGVMKPTSINMPNLPRLNEGSFTIEMLLTFSELSANQVLFDNQIDKNKGISISTNADKKIMIEVGDGDNTPYIWTMDENVLTLDKEHYIAFIVDGKARVISVVIDGRLLDGGERHQYGWRRFSNELGDVNGLKRATLIGSASAYIRQINIYDRYLTTSESISNSKFYNK